MVGFSTNKWVARSFILKIFSFSITNYRSITTAHKIELGNHTVLIGKNNEGKSNILKALNLAMEILTKPYNVLRRSSTAVRRHYNWTRDFPIQYQDRKKGLQSIFRIGFKLDDSERNTFYQETGSWINGDLEIIIKLGKAEAVDIAILKKGKNATSLTEKSHIITSFISKHISFIYIPTIRTETQINKIINELLRTELSGIEETDEYIKALDVIANLQQEKLDSITEKLKAPLQEFVPSIKDVNIQFIEGRREEYIVNRCEIIIDDGIATSIEYKGDGVKSLVAIAMLKSYNSTKKSTVIAIEEPESHLHPSAIHSLNDTIYGMATDNQVIISTHNPLFVSRDTVEANVIVGNGKANPAKSIKEIREVLGVLASDNLINASYVLVVEGEDDKISLLKLLPKMSEKIAAALKSSVFIIEEIGGAGNLSYKLSSLKICFVSIMFCSTMILLDKLPFQRHEMMDWQI
jgi:predicted ATP-dependent endonuclease of OLD family